MRPRTAARCAELSKTYRTETSTVEALRGVDIDFSPAAVTAIVGPSGSGKSSLLRLLAGLDSPTAGKVWVGETELTALAPGSRRRARKRLVGYVFQRPSDNFISYLTVGEHLRLARALSGQTTVDHAELLEELRLHHRRDHKPKHLSGGEQQRAALAQAMVAGPSVIVADEPTAELDKGTGAAVLAMVAGLAGKGLAFVIASHDPQVAAMADVVVRLEHGRVIG